MNPMKFASTHGLSALLLTLLMATGGCALSPQTVNLQPTVQAPPRDIGHGQTIALTVTDARKEQAFGPRGGVYPSTSLITPGESVATSIRRSLIPVLHDYGFTVVQPGAASSQTMQVIVEEIRYTPLLDSVPSQVQTSAALRVACNNGGKTFQSRYSAKSTQDILAAPGAQQNERFLNTILSKILERMMTDQALLDFMQSGATNP
jgi:uncharacterized lipoprotein